MVLQSIKMALKAILASKTRSFLTMLGIIIGVFSLVVLVSLVNGATGYVTDSIDTFGNDYLELSVYNDKGLPVDDEELRNLEKMEVINELTPELTTNATFSADGIEKKGTLRGVNSAYFMLENVNVEFGRDLNTVDVENASKVAVINLKTAQELFKKNDAVGEHFKINGVEYQVVGIQNDQDGSFTAMITNEGYFVYIPQTAYLRQFKYDTDDGGYTTILLSVNGDVNAAKDELNDYFYKRFNNDKDAFSIVTMDELKGVLNGITTALAVVFGGVAAISLLVGGIGIMNIMLVSVTERTKEIGIRKAIGASKKSILLQFLIEAFVISITGCLIGLVFSYLFVGLANLIVQLLDIKLHFDIPFYAILSSVSFSLLVGLAFGIYPANKAAKKKPIEALRYDG